MVHSQYSYKYDVQSRFSVKPLPYTFPFPYKHLHIPMNIKAALAAEQPKLIKLSKWKCLYTVHARLKFMMMGEISRFDNSNVPTKKHCILVCIPWASRTVVMTAPWLLSTVLDLKKSVLWLLSSELLPLYIKNAHKKRSRPHNYIIKCSIKIGVSIRKSLDTHHIENNVKKKTLWNRHLNL